MAWFNKDKDWHEKIQGILGGALMGDQGLPGPNYIQNLIGQSNNQLGALSISGLLKNVAGSMNKAGSLTQNIAKNIGEGGPSNIVNKKNMPWLYEDGKKTPSTKDIPGEVEQLKIPGLDWDKVTNPMQRALQIAHGVHTPDFVHDGIPRFISPGRHDPTEHRTPVDDYNNPIPSLKPRDEDIPLSNLRNLLIRTVA